MSEPKTKALGRPFARGDDQRRYKRGSTPKGVLEVVALARAASPAAMQALIDNLKDADGNVRNRAAREVLIWGYGSPPKTPVHVDVPEEPGAIVKEAERRLLQLGLDGDLPALLAVLRALAPERYGKNADNVPPADGLDTDVPGWLPPDAPTGGTDGV